MCFSFLSLATRTCAAAGVFQGRRCSELPAGRSGRCRGRVQGWGSGHEHAEEGMTPSCASPVLPRRQPENANLKSQGRALGVSLHEICVIPGKSLSLLCKIVIDFLSQSVFWVCRKTEYKVQRVPEDVLPQHAGFPLTLTFDQCFSRTC